MKTINKIWLIVRSQNNDCLHMSIIFRWNMEEKSISNMVTGQQQFNLRWNNHTNNILQVFMEQYANEGLVDVTIACDGHFIKAHKMVLSACSPYFQVNIISFNLFFNIFHVMYSTCSNNTSGLFWCILRLTTMLLNCFSSRFSILLLFFLIFWNICCYFVIVLMSIILIALSNLF